MRGSVLERLVKMNRHLAFSEPCAAPPRIRRTAATSLAFALSAAHGLVGPGLPDPHEAFLAGFYTVVGALCFLAGSYLLIPELFDGETCVPATDATRDAA